MDIFISWASIGATNEKTLHCTQSETVCQHWILEQKDSSRWKEINYQWGNELIKEQPRQWKANYTK